MSTNGRILVVEDSPADIELIDKAIESIEGDLSYLAKRNGKEALDHLRSNKTNPPDLIILDIDMPKMNGYEFLEQLSSHDSSLDCTPVVVMTTSGATDDIRRAYDHGANTCVTKPLGFKSFREDLKTICEYWFKVAHLPWEIAE